MTYGFKRPEVVPSAHKRLSLAHSMLSAKDIRVRTPTPRRGYPCGAERSYAHMPFWRHTDCCGLFKACFGAAQESIVA